MRRSLKSNLKRPNYAKRAKDFGLNYISITKIQKYFKKDWEKQIESKERRFTWEYITRNLIRREVFVKSIIQFSDFINELISEGLPVIERRRLEIRYYSRKYRQRLQEKRHRLRNNEEINRLI